MFHPILFYGGGGGNRTPVQTPSANKINREKIKGEKNCPKQESLTFCFEVARKPKATDM